MPLEPLSSQELAESLYAGLVEDSTVVSSDQVEELCSRHPELAADLRALHGVRELLDGFGPGAAPTDSRGARGPAGGTPPAIEGFQFLRRLGRGGMGEVWEASDSQLGRRVAVKLLAPFATSSRERERFRREALSAARLRHPNVVALLSAGEHEERSYLVQELIAGGRTLRDEIEELRRAGVVPKGYERRVAERFAALADALARAHDEGVVHRDVKPQNVLLEPDGTPKLADFGLAKTVGDVSLSRTGEFVGTYPYASPEQVSRGKSPVGPASDVFSLGATLYECLTLTRPFSGDDPAAIMREIQQADPADPRALRSSVPLELAVICLRALEKRPPARYPSMAALRDDLRRYLAGDAILARPPSQARRLQRAVWRHPTAATAVGLAAVAWIVILFFLARAERARAAAELANRRLQESNAALDAARVEMEVEADTTGEVLGFLSGLFQSGDPLRYGLEDSTLKEVILAGAARMRTAEVTEPRVRVRLLAELGTLLSRLGHWDEATAMLQEASKLWDALGQGSSPPAVETRVALAVAHWDQGHTAECRALIEPLVASARPPSDLPVATRLAILATAGFDLTEAGDPARGEELLREALELEPDVPVEARWLIPSTRAALVACLIRQGRVSEAAERVEPLCAELEPLLATGNPTALDAFNLRGKVRLEEGRLAEGLADFEAALRAAEAALGPTHPRCMNLRTNVATACISLQRWSEAEELLRLAIEIGTQNRGETSMEVLAARSNLGTVLIATNRCAEAEDVLRAVVAEEIALHGEAHLQTALARSNLAICLFYLGRSAEAAELQQAALESIAADVAERPRMEGALEVYRRTAGSEH